MKIVFFRKGFSLLELLTATAVIVILAGVLLPSLARSRVKAQQVVCSGNLREIFRVFEFYCSDYKGIYPCADDNSKPWLWMGRGWKMFVTDYISGNVDVLRCPAEHTDKYENTSYGYSMSFYHSVEQINSMKDKSMTYSNPVFGVAVHREDVLYPSKKILSGEWFSNHKPVTGDYKTEPGWWSWKGIRNFVFADGHVEFLPAKEIRKANDNWPDPNLTVNGFEGVDK